MSSSLVVSALPRCVALRSKHDKRYLLRCVPDERHGGSVVELGHGDGGIMDPRARFYLEPSKEHEGLVHVRCCYNNKYWVPQQRLLDDLDGGSSNAPRWVVGTADEPEEDLSKPSCTLHKHVIVADGAGAGAGGEEEEEGGGYTCRFLHSQLGKYTCVSSASSVTSSIRPYLYVAAQDDQEEVHHQDDNSGLIVDDAFILIDVSKRKQLPSYVAFKGDNGYFLGARVIQRYNYLQFADGEVSDPRALHTVFTNDDGVVRIKSNHFGLFWRRSPNWIWADSNDSTHKNRDTLFTVTTGDDFIALRNLGNNNFCKRLTTEGKTSCLNAGDGSISLFARLQCHEPVISRDIYDVNFRLSEARKYTTDINGLDSQTVRNMTSTTHKTKLAFTYTSTVESTWSSTVSMKMGVTTKLKSGVPFVAKGEIEVSTEFSGSYTWGKTESEQRQINREIEVEVPPMKKVTVHVLGSNGYCDIPFSYTQRDVLFNGQEVIQKFTDGMYFGVKTSDVLFETIEEDL